MKNLKRKAIHPFDYTTTNDLKKDTRVRFNLSKDALAVMYPSFDHGDVYVVNRVFLPEQTVSKKEEIALKDNALVFVNPQHLVKA